MSQTGPQGRLRPAQPAGELAMRDRCASNFAPKLAFGAPLRLSDWRQGQKNWTAKSARLTTFSMPFNRIGRVA
jgi:hypothetical protein